RSLGEEERKRHLDPSLACLERDAHRRQKTPQRRRPECSIDRLDQGYEARHVRPALLGRQLHIEGPGTDACTRTPIAPGNLQWMTHGLDADPLDRNATTVRLGLYVGDREPGTHDLIQSDPP